MIVYVSHSLGEANGKDQARRQDNISNAIDWYAFLFEHTSWILHMPWFASVVALRELHRPRAYAHQILLIGRSDAIALVGGFVSPHMAEEMKKARREHLAIIDLTDLGVRPPRGEPDNIRELLRERELAAVRAASERTPE